MPLYEYLCHGCGHRFERIVHGTAVPDCPSCQARNPEKLISGFAWVPRVISRREDAARAETRAAPVPVQ